MQAFSAVHLQHLQSAFAVLARRTVEKQQPLTRDEEASVLPDLDGKKPLLDNQPAVELISSVQLLATLVSQQEQTIQGLQTFVNQLTELIKELKQLKEQGLVLSRQLPEIAVAVSEPEPQTPAAVVTESVFKPEISFPSS
jgi:hypothetical protein